DAGDALTVGFGSAMSVTVGRANVTTAPCCDVAAVVTPGVLPMMGRCVSRTMTGNDVEPGALLAPCAVQVTCVDPSGKVAPGPSGAQTGVSGPSKSFADTKNEGTAPAGLWASAVTPGGPKTLAIDGVMTIVPVPVAALKAFVSNGVNVARTS